MSMDLVVRRMRPWDRLGGVGKPPPLADLFLALPPGGKGQRKLQCFDCDRPDPMKTDEATGWLSGELGRTHVGGTD